MDLQSLELAVNDQGDSSKSSHHVGLISPDMNTPNLAQKITEMSKPEEPAPSKSVKKITAETNIHPQHKMSPRTGSAVQPPLQRPDHARMSIEVTSCNQRLNHVQSPQDAVTSPEEGFEYMIGNDDDDGMPLGLGIEAPCLTLTEPTGASQDAFVASTEPVVSNVHSNGINASGPHGYSKGYAPTPREWQYDWNATPRNPQSRTPATRLPPRIRDPELIHNTLQSIAYYADKLDGLHTEYRRRYAEQQQVAEYMSTLQQQQHTMDPAEYHNRYNYYQSSSTSLSQCLQNLIISIYTRFTEMKQRLETRHDYLLDSTMRSSFDKFQKYHDQFAQSQQHLLVFGQQQAASAQQPPSKPPPNTRQQQAQNVQNIQNVQSPRSHPNYANHSAHSNHHNRSPQMVQNQQSKPTPQHQYYGSNRQIPPTPQKYQNYVQREWQQARGQQQLSNKLQLPNHLQGVHSMTPRGNSYYQTSPQRQVNYAQSTTAIDRTFRFSKDAQRQHMNYNNSPMKMSRTPRGNASYGQHHGGHAAKNGMNQIPSMGYVYIGSRMSQLISQIGFADNELMQRQSGIQDTITAVLSEEKEMFKGFDIVPYGASTHGLFIKGYSDYDYCIRCKDLAVPHREAIECIAKGLRALQGKCDSVRVVESVKESVHGHYLEDIEHIVFVDKGTGRSVDVVLNNLPEIGSSRFIAAYDSIDPRFALLCRVVKYWARQRKINDPLKGSLSTFSLVLMVINFLQSRRVLPTLSIMIFDRESGLSPWSTQDDYQINVQKYRDFASKNEEPHSRLLVNFFHFYSHKFNWTKDVVSVRTGTLLMKSEKKWSDQAHALAVENPFNSKVNLAENVTPQSLQRICAEFKRAHSILCESYKIYEVCKMAE